MQDLTNCITAQSTADYCNEGGKQIKKSYQRNFTLMAEGKLPGCRVFIKARMATRMGNFDGWNIRIDGDLDSRFFRNQADVKDAVNSALVEWKQLRKKMYANSDIKDILKKFAAEMAEIAKLKQQREKSK